MMEVLWFVQGKGAQHESKVPNATDFLQSLSLVDHITLAGNDYRVNSTEMVVDKEPYLIVLMEEDEE